MTAHFQLPELPYAYDALEPWCSAETLQFHHDKHHKAYVDGANAAAEELARIDPGDAYRLAGVTTAFEFNVAGHLMHSLLWENLAPEPTRPEGALADRIDEDFGSFDRCRELLQKACTGVQGSGWGVIAWDPLSGALHVGAVHDHQDRHVPSGTMLAVVDVWEHAYYLGYRNDRAGWVRQAVEHLAWPTIAQRYETIHRTLQRAA